jgi:hypothetical protein
MIVDYKPIASELLKIAKLISGNQYPELMTPEEFSITRFEPNRDENRFPIIGEVKKILEDAGLTVLDIGVKGSRSFGVETHKSDHDVYVSVPPNQFHKADDIGAKLSSKGIDLLVNWTGEGKSGGILRGDKTHKRIIEKALDHGKNVSAIAVDEYGIKVPEAYIRDGKYYVYH